MCLIMYSSKFFLVELYVNDNQDVISLINQLFGAIYQGISFM